MLAGVHENLYQSKLFDLDLKKTAALLDRLGDADVAARRGVDVAADASVVAVSLVVAQPDRCGDGRPRFATLSLLCG